MNLLIVLVISRAILNDSGVYTLTARRIDGTYMIFKVVTLAVIPIKESVTIRETLPMHVMCHCAILGYVYSDLKIYWMIDNKIWKDYSVTLPVAVNVDHIPAVNRSHHGMWKCIVEQIDLNFKWTTNVIRVKGNTNIFFKLMMISNSDNSFISKHIQIKYNTNNNIIDNILYV